MKRDLLAVLCLGLLVAAPAMPQEAGQAASDQQTADEQQVRRRETIEVVSASKTQQALIDAPATMSVVTADTIASSPAQNYGDLLRSVPGLNVTQTSARDINMTSRQNTTSLTNSQLVLVDGRSVYLDFFGLVLWDFIPQGANEIKQIEVVRGPASVVWGANALTGVVNIITKTPRDAEGFGVTLSGGLFNRDEGSREADGSGYSYGGSFNYANAPNDTWSYKLSAGYFNSDPYSRPVGTVPLGTHPLDSSIITGGAPYPSDSPAPGSWVNDGTSQPRADLRVDQDLASGGRITYQGGYAGTEGIIHTGIGPFDIQSDSYMAYGKVVYTKGALRVGAFGNFVDAKAPNLLQTDPATLQPVLLTFKTQTYDVEIGHSSVLGGKHILTYGGNYRRNNFDITLTPQSEDRNEFGGDLQWEFFTSKFRVALGGRVDKFGNLDDAVFSPRVNVMFKPTPDHAIRVSYNRAFRSPSVVNNYLDQNILQPPPFTDLRPLVPPPVRPLVPNEPFRLVLNTYGNTELKEEHIDAFEIAYTGTIGGRTTIGLALYRNDSNDNINFTYLYPATPGLDLPPPEYYSATNPAQGVGVVTGQRITCPVTGQPGICSFLQPPLGPIALPYKVATYLNLGPLRNQGFEASIDHRFSNSVSGFANYSWQDTPEIRPAESGQIPYPVKEVGIPPENRFNVGLNVNTSRFLGNVSLNYQDSAFWNDVLNEPYWGTTDSFTMVNATLGVKFAEGNVVASVKGTNIFNERIQQHIYGDLLRSSFVLELRFFTK